MGNSQCLVYPTEGDESRFARCYKLSGGKEGFAVLVGNGDSSSNDALSSMDSALKKNCHIDTQAPFLSSTNNKTMPAFSKENFDRLCALIFQEDMIQSLGQYSSYFYHFCGNGDETGMLTTDDQCIPYVTIVKKVLEHTTHSSKPTVFIFECHCPESSQFRIESIASSFTDQLGPETSDTVICFTFLSTTAGSGGDDCPAGPFTAELANAIRQYSHLFSLTDLIDLAGSRAQIKTGGILQGPLCLDYLKAQFMLIEDPSAKIFQEPEQWIEYTSGQIKQNFADESPPSDLALPGNGHGVLLLFSHDACGPRPPTSLMYSLADSLTNLGFEVFCDCVGRTTPQRDWSRWYSVCLSLCDCVILVSSPLMCKAFTQAAESSSQSPSPASSCVRILTQVQQRLATSTGTILRTFPVILTSQFDSSHVPTMFAGGKIYHINEAHLATPFDHAHIGNAYHSLIFGMARLPLPNTAAVGKVLKVKPEYKKVASTDTLSLSGHCPSFSSLEEIKDYFYRPVKQGYKVVTRISPSSHPQGLFPTPPNPHSYNVIPPNPHSYNVIPAMQQPPYYPQQLQSRPLPPLSSVPDLSRESVSIQAMLWLTGKVVQWKFLGRRLGLDDFQLQRIEYENPRDLSEQCYQMLRKWAGNCREEEANYKVLCSALQFAESEKMKNEFVEFVAKNCLTGHS